VGAERAKEDGEKGKRRRATTVQAAGWTFIALAMLLPARFCYGRGFLERINKYFRSEARKEPNVRLAGEDVHTSSDIPCASSPIGAAVSASECKDRDRK
jgi:hypothetical protein